MANLAVAETKHMSRNSCALLLVLVWEMMDNLVVAKRLQLSRVATLAVAENRYMGN